MKNDFSVDTVRQVKKDFLGKIRIPLGIAIFLTAFETIAGIWFFIRGVTAQIWNAIGAYEMGVKGIHYLSVLCILVCLIKMICDEKPFSHTLTVCVRIISALHLLGSVLFPRLPDFETNYSVLSLGSFTLIDGNFLIKALLLYVFSVIIHEGFSMQKDMEEIL